MAATERLAITVLLTLLLLGGAAVASADDRAGTSLFIHTDDDGLTVIHPATSVRVAVGDSDHVSARYDADVITAATVDVRTSASPRGFDETRHGGGVGVEHDLSRTLHLAGGYGFSWSPDYVTHAGSTSLAVEDATRNHTVTVGASVAHDTVARAGDVEPVGHATSVGGSASWAWLLSSEAVADITAAAEWRSGYLENPYRFVPIESSSGQNAVRVPENLPDDWVRASLRARLRFSPRHWLFLRGSYRFHFDDWGVAGHTVRLRVAVEPAKRWLAWASFRFHGQRAAGFYEGRYTTLPRVPEFRTLDRELAHSFYVAGGTGASYEMFELAGFTWRADLRAELVRTRYFDTPALRDRTAVTVGVGLSVER